MIISGSDAHEFCRYMETEANKVIKSTPIGIPNYKLDMYMKGKYVYGLDFTNSPLQIKVELTPPKRQEGLIEYLTDDLEFIVNTDDFFQFMKAVKDNKANVTKFKTNEDLSIFIETTIPDLHIDLSVNERKNTILNDYDVFQSEIHSKVIPENFLGCGTINVDSLKETETPVWLILDEYDDLPVIMKPSIDAIDEKDELGVIIKKQFLLLKTGIVDDTELSFYKYNEKYDIAVISNANKKIKVTQYFKCISISTN